MKTIRIITSAILFLAFSSNVAHAEEVIIKPVLEPVTPTGGVAGIGAGDLIKLANDHNPATHEDEAVYYLDKDWIRRSFPNQSIYKSWYPDFSGVKELSKEQLAIFRLGKNITYRPGTRLIKIPSIAKVYAVEPGGALRWIESESVAKALYGNDWSKRVDDVAETFFVDYKETVALTAPAWPTGTVLRRNEDGSLFLIDGFGRRRLTEESLATMHLNTTYAIRASEATIAAYPEIGVVDKDERRFKDTAQQDFLETLPPPQFDVVEVAHNFTRGQESTLATLRIVSGMPVIVRQMRVKISGPLHGADAANLTDIHLTDSKGNDLFGIQQLPDGANNEAALAFSGAFTTTAGLTGEIQLRAKTSAMLESGKIFKIEFDRSSLSLADGGNGDSLTRYFNIGEFPAVMAKAN